MCRLQLPAILAEFAFMIASSAVFFERSVAPVEFQEAAIR
jgi:hypothetical protein